jgi:hypothetical protein
MHGMAKVNGGFRAAHRTETKNGAEHVRNALLDVDAGGRAGPG